MRGLILSGGVLLVLGLAAPAAAQPSASFDRIIDASFRLFSPVDDCTVPRAVLHLARSYEFVAGVEFLRSPCAKLGAPPARYTSFVDLQDLTVKEALSTILAADSRYRMRDNNGVVVVRPEHAWTDPRNMLNFTASSFALEDATLGIALDTVLSALVGERRSVEDRFGTATEQGARKFSVKIGTASAAEALEAIVRAHGAAVWEVREAELFRVVSFFTFDGAGMGVGLKGLQ